MRQTPTFTIQTGEKADRARCSDAIRLLRLRADEAAWGCRFMKRNPLLLGFAIACFGGPAAAQNFAPDMLFGSIITSEITEERTIQDQATRRRQTVSSVSRITIGTGPTAQAVDQVTTTTEGRALGVRTYRTGQVAVGTPFKYRDGMMVFVFEGNQLRRLRTLGDGARMGTFEFFVKDGVLSCKVSVGMLRENGTGQIKVEGKQNHTILNSRMTASSCTVKRG